MEQSTMHPMAEKLVTFVNEAITIEEAKARVNLFKNVVADLERGIAEFEASASQEPSATDEAGQAVEVEEVK